MRFSNPAGLWLLLGVPALIIIYLIKSQHEDAPVSSTYIWQLSARFMKRRLPVQRLRRILLFILQLCMLIAAAFIAAKPVVIDGARHHYIAVIDASASMQTRDSDGISRFEYALEQAETLAQSVNRGHTVSIILAGDSAAYLVRASDSLSELKEALSHAECGYGGCSDAEAMTLAEALAAESENPRVLFFTDREFQEAENLTVVNLDKNEWNVSVDSVSAVRTPEETTFTGILTSRNKSASVSVGFRLDGDLLDARRIELPADTPTEITFRAAALSHYDTAEIFIEEADGLAADNMAALCNKNADTYKILLVSRSPLYLESALSAMGNCEVTALPMPAELAMSGHDLYIFDGIAMNRYPEDGSVLLLGLGRLPGGLSAGKAVESEAALTASDSALTAGLRLHDTVVSAYTELVGDGSWEPVLSCGDTPVLMTKATDGGKRFTVCSFDLHDSNLPMKPDFALLMKNIVDFSVPALLRDRDYTVGDTITFGVSDEAEALFV
ncbi:MAG: BatA and WFA domain-containing protein, partial [Clostridia bacterium]|nr:BatA and WFA domain-containing protein [Clostridia bacterium]